MRAPRPPGFWAVDAAKKEGRPEPHWAVAVLHDHRGRDLPEIVQELDYPRSVDKERALGMFGMDVPGWVPYWFPRVMHLKQWTPDEEVVHVSDQQRLDWFDKALEYYAQTEWPPTGSITEMKTAICLSLLYMCRDADGEELPAPDRM